MKKRKAIFLDRDGTLNPDPGYINSPEQFEFHTGVPEGLKTLKEAGFHLVLITNQSGIGRGLVQVENLAAIHEKMQNLLKIHNVQLDKIYFCPHKPDDDCTCRKPSPEMILRAIKEADLNARDSFMIGDKLSDVEAGLNAGVTSILISPSLDRKFSGKIVKSFAEAVNWILERTKYSKF